jgi:DNA invertase Pin-like site-specific DNA recombinase
MTAAIIYCRVSMQDDEALRNQEVACRKLVEDRGWEVADVWAEVGDPGRRLGLALTYVDIGRGDLIVTWDITRVFRRPADLLYAMNTGEATEHHHPVTIVTVQGEDWEVEWSKDGDSRD